MNQQSPWFWCALGAVTMSLGWGLRGSIGGGALGAMIPGAMIGLALAILLRRRGDVGLLAAFAAVGIGFGGQETYGQTVGLSLQPGTFGWAILGFALKGGAWGLLGGLAIGIALSRRNHRTRDLIIAFGLMDFGTWAGWKLINEPKLIYFSNPVDRPREELWAALWIGGLLLLVWLRARIPAVFGAWGAVGGTLGFAGGAALQVWGREAWPGMRLGWWKGMELTFGAILGAALTGCAWRWREAIPQPQKVETRTGPFPAILFGAGTVIVAIVLTVHSPMRAEYAIPGAVLLGLCLCSEAFAWQTAITATAAAFLWDFLRNQKVFPAAPVWVFLVFASAAIAVLVGRTPRAMTLFLFLTWLAVADSCRYLLPPLGGVGAYTMVAVFVALAAVCSWMALKMSSNLL